MHRKARLLAALVVPWVVFLAATLVIAGPTAPSIPAIGSHVEIATLEVGADGETYFSTGQVRWMDWFISGRRTTETPVTGLQFYHIKQSLKMGWHPAPRKQYLLILQGLFEVEASSGEKRRFPPGSIVLLTDIAGSRGHIARVIGPEDVFAAVMPIP